MSADAFTAQYLARAVAERIVADRPGWEVVPGPPPYLGSFTFDHETKPREGIR